MKKELLNKIEVNTLPNGYGLSVNGEDFMYFNELDLLAGFMSHVGLQESKALERGTILSSLFSAMLGDAYADAVTLLKQRVGLLTSKYEATLQQMDRSIEYVNQAEKTVNGLLQDVKILEDKLKAVGAEHKSVKDSVDEAKKKVDEIAKKSEKVMNSLANSATIMKAMEEAKKGEKKADGEAGDTPEEAPAGEAPEKSKKGKGGRKKNDEKLLAEIERQAKENPNVK